MDWTGLGERVLWFIVAIVIISFCWYFISTALEWLENDTQTESTRLRTAQISWDQVIIK